MKGIFKNITLNTFASSAGRIIGGLAGLFIVGLIARSLGARGFGEYATIVAYLSTFQILADLGLYSLLTREISQNPENEKGIVGSFLTLRLFVAAFFLFIASILVFVFPYSIEVKMGVVFAASGFLFLSLSQIFLGVFQKYLQVYKAAISEVAGRMVQLGIVWLFFSTNGTLFSYVGALVAGSFTIFALNLFFARRLVAFRLGISLNQWSGILKKTYPIAVSLLFTLLYFKADTILLSVLKSPEDVGLYNASYKVLETLIFFPAAFAGLMLPVISRYAKENREKLSELLSALSDIMTIFAIPIVVGGVLLSATFVYIIGGAEFLAATPVMMVLFLAIGIIFYGTIWGNSVIALDLQKKAMKIYFAGFIFNFIANLFFIPAYSYMGAAWTTVATELIVTAWLFWTVRCEVRFGISVPAILKAALGAALMGIFILYFTGSIFKPVSIYMFLILIFGGGLIYSAFGLSIFRSLVKKRVLF
ncbi:MAG: flippase [Candidatus Spechtbacteria bacterium]|nr:flippase [Candidatus Spechtbacteria bacterium]